MLSVKKIKETNKYVLYQYFPEDKLSFGIIKFGKEGSGEVIKMEEEYGEVYALKAMSLMRMFSKKNEYPENGIIQWF